MEKDKKLDFFEEKILPLLNYIGAIGAVITSIAYIIIVFVLIQGFEKETTLHTTVFALVNAGVGFVILQFLKYQGISFAEMKPENEEILKQYYGTKTKDKKSHSMIYFWITSVVKDVFIKCATLAITSIGIVYLIIKGNKDYNLILLAIVNLLMFICFGFLSLVKSYKYFNRTYIKYIKERLAEVEQSKEE